MSWLLTRESEPVQKLGQAFTNVLKIVYII